MFVFLKQACPPDLQNNLSFFVLSLISFLLYEVCSLQYFFSHVLSTFQNSVQITLWDQFPGRFIFSPIYGLKHLPQRQFYLWEATSRREINLDCREAKRSR